MENFFGNIDVERAFAEWFQRASRDKRKSATAYTHTHMIETIEYRVGDRHWPFPLKIREISREKEVVDNNYPANVRLVNDFLKSYGTAIYEDVKYDFYHMLCSCCYSQQDMKARLKIAGEKASSRSMTEFDVKIYYRTCIDISDDLEKTLSAACEIGYTKANLYDGYHFFQRVRQNPNVKRIQKCLECLEETDTGRGFSYDIFKSWIGYYAYPMGSEDGDSIHYGNLGLRDLSSDSERLGLGFAIAELFLEKRGLDLKTGILEQKIHVRYPGKQLFHHDYAITFSVDSEKKKTIQKLQDW